MPPDSVACPCTPAAKLPIDHWSNGECLALRNPMLAPMPVRLMQAILDDSLGDKRHANMQVTVTRLLGCPREAILADLFDYTLKPEMHNSQFIGTTWHKLAYDPKLSDGFDGFEFMGLRLSGEADYVAPDRSFIEDGKFHGDASLKFKVDQHKLVEDTLVAQLNLYRLGLEAKWGTPGVVKRLFGRHGAMSAAGRSAYHPVEVPLRDEKWIAGVRPLDGLHSVAEIAAIWRLALQKKAEGVEADEILKVVGLVGLTMFPDKKTGKGRKCESYCEMAGLCGAKAEGGMRW